jgi:hypothetical protein
MPKINYAIEYIFLDLVTFPFETSCISVRAITEGKRNAPERTCNYKIWSADDIFEQIPPAWKWSRTVKTAGKDNSGCFNFSGPEPSAGSFWSSLGKRKKLPGCSKNGFLRESLFSLKIRRAFLHKCHHAFHSVFSRGDHNHIVGFYLQPFFDGRFQPAIDRVNDKFYSDGRLSG